MIVRPERRLSNLKGDFNAAGYIPSNVIRRISQLVITPQDERKNVVAKERIASSAFRSLLPVMAFDGNVQGVKHLLTQNVFLINEKFSFAPSELLSERELDDTHYVPPLATTRKLFLAMSVAEPSSMSLDQRWLLTHSLANCNLLHYACLGNQLQMAEFLVGIGCDPGATNEARQLPSSLTDIVGLRNYMRKYEAASPLHCVAMPSLVSRANLLSGHPSHNTPIVTSARRKTSVIITESRTRPLLQSPLLVPMDVGDNSSVTTALSFSSRTSRLSAKKLKRVLASRKHSLTLLTNSQKAVPPSNKQSTTPVPGNPQVAVLLCNALKTLTQSATADEYVDLPPSFAIQEGRKASILHTRSPLPPIEICTMAARFADVPVPPTSSSPLDSARQPLSTSFYPAPSSSMDNAQSIPPFSFSSSSPPYPSSSSSCSSSSSPLRAFAAKDVVPPPFPASEEIDERYRHIKLLLKKIAADPNLDEHKRYQLVQLLLGTVHDHQQLEKTLSDLKKANASSSPLDPSRLCQPVLTETTQQVEVVDRTSNAAHCLAGAGEEKEGDTKKGNRNSTASFADDKKEGDEMTCETNEKTDAGDKNPPLLQQLYANLTPIEAVIKIFYQDAFLDQLSGEAKERGEEGEGRVSIGHDLSVMLQKRLENVQFFQQNQSGDSINNLRSTSAPSFSPHLSTTGLSSRHLVKRRTKEYLRRSGANRVLLKDVKRGTAGEIQRTGRGGGRMREAINPILRKSFSPSPKRLPHSARSAMIVPKASLDSARTPARTWNKEDGLASSPLCSASSSFQNKKVAFNEGVQIIIAEFKEAAWADEIWEKVDTLGFAATPRLVQSENKEEEDAATGSDEAKEDSEEKKQGQERTSLGMEERKASAPK